MTRFPQLPKEALRMPRFQVHQVTHLLSPPNAVVTVAGGSLEFNLPIQVEGSLSFLRPNNILTFDGKAGGLSKEYEIKVLENVNIDDFTHVKCLYNKNNLYPSVEIKGVGAPYHVVRENGRLSAQFQCVDDRYTKARTKSYILPELCYLIKSTS
jgi:hypothetical protein